jgi:hypothetical protein
LAKEMTMYRFFLPFRGETMQGIAAVQPLTTETKLIGV